MYIREISCEWIEIHRHRNSNAFPFQENLLCTAFRSAEREDRERETIIIVSEQVFTGPRRIRF